MKLLLLTVITCSLVQISTAQNVGIGTTTPRKELSVAGSIVVDYDNRNRGQLDSAALLFGSNPFATGISSSKSPLQSDFQGLSFWTNNEKRMTILSNGYVGINNNNPQYHFSLNGHMYVNDNATINNHLRVNQRVGIGGIWDFSYRLAVQGGNSLFNDRVHIGGSTNAGYQLHVQSTGGAKAAMFYGDVDMNDHLTVGKNLSVDQHINADGNLTLGGNAFIGGAADFTYKMRVYGNARVDDNFRVNGKFAAGGAVDDNYFSRTYGSAKVDDDLRVDSRVAVGGAVDNNFKLRVYGGNSRFGGDAEVVGTLNAANIAATNGLTIGGKGSVKSNGASPLKIHFTEVFVDHEFTHSGEQYYYYINLPDFASTEDVRISISHFESNIPAGYNPQNVLTYFTELNPVQNTAVLALRSITSANFIIGGTYYITVIMKDN